MKRSALVCWWLRSHKRSCMGKSFGLPWRMSSWWCCFQADEAQRKRTSFMYFSQTQANSKSIQTRHNFLSLSVAPFCSVHGARGIRLFCWPLAASSFYLRGTMLVLQLTGGTARLHGSPGFVMLLPRFVVGSSHVFLGLGKPLVVREVFRSRRLADVPPVLRQKPDETVFSILTKRIAKWTFWKDVNLNSVFFFFRKEHVLGLEWKIDFLTDAFAACVAGVSQRAKRKRHRVAWMVCLRQREENPEDSAAKLNAPLDYLHLGKEFERVWECQKDVLYILLQTKQPSGRDLKSPWGVPSRMSEPQSTESTVLKVAKLLKSVFAVLKEHWSSTFE